MENAEGVFDYVVSRVNRGDSDARALVDAIQAQMMASDAEERARKSRSFNRR